MSWQQDMSRAAVSLALPGWEWREGDVAELDADWDAGGTFEGGEMTITVTVERGDLTKLRDEQPHLFWDFDGEARKREADSGQRRCAVFVNDAAARFWTDLMRAR